MSQTGTDRNSGPSEFALLILGMSFLGIAGFMKVQPRLLLFWANYQFVIVVVASFGCALLVILGISVLWNRRADRKDREEVTAKDATAIFLGTDEKGGNRYIKQKYRVSHTHVLGTTSAGKTESIILPWAIRDIENGSGMLIIDGKSDRSFLDKLYAYVVKNKREKDFRLFSLALPGPSSSFNPLTGGSAYEVSERVFSAFPIENSYYRAIQFKLFQSVLSLVNEAGGTPTFALIHHLISDRDALHTWLKGATKPVTRRVLSELLKLDDGKRSELVSGLEANLSHFVLSDPAVLFNQPKSDIQFDDVLKNRLICYFQLPTLIYPFLGEATGKLVLQCYEAAIGRTQVGLTERSAFFSCFLDDFQDYIFPGFASVLNKSRSAGVGVVFSHQSLGNLDKVGTYFREEVTSCTNIKVFMRTNDPLTAEYCASSIGTRTAKKITERQTKGMLVTSKTGDQSVREVEEFVYHPNEIKRLHRGQAIIQIPGEREPQTFKIDLQARPDLARVPLPEIGKAPLTLDKNPTVLMSAPKKSL